MTNTSKPWLRIAPHSADRGAKQSVLTRILLGFVFMAFGIVLLTALISVFMLYLRPDFMRDVSDLLYSCF